MGKVRKSSKALLEKQAKLDIRDRARDSILHLATSGESVIVVKILLEKQVQGGER